MPNKLIHQLYFFKTNLEAKKINKVITPIIAGIHFIIIDAIPILK